MTTEITRTENGLTGLHSIRLGQYKIGFRFNIYHHGIAFRFLFGHIADCVGILNRFKNTDLQCLFIDFDKSDLNKVIEYCLEIQEKYWLSDIYLFESSPNHFNMICCDLLEPKIIREILIDCPLVDNKFRTIYLLNNDNTLRITPKFTEKENRTINLLMVISSKFARPYQHKGLMLLINRYFYIGIDYLRSDNSTENDLIFKEYETIQW